MRVEAPCQEVAVVFGKAAARITIRPFESVAKEQRISGMMQSNTVSKENDIPSTTHRLGSGFLVAIYEHMSTSADAHSFAQRQNIGFQVHGITCEQDV